jgi:DNA polymerase type B, organellar and viral
LKPLKSCINITENFITMDFETRIIKNNSGDTEVYCINLYDGYEKKSFYLLDYKDSESMLTSSIEYLMKRKYDNYKIYFHNFSYFDVIYLFKVLTKLSNRVTPLIRDGRFIDIKFTFSDEKSYNLYFRDSYLQLPSSLASLAKNFYVENKGIFPYKFVNNKNIDLNYIGKFPRIQNFIEENKKFDIEKYIKY